LHLVLSLFALVLPLINLFNINLWSRLFNRFSSVDIILLIFTVFVGSRAATVENLVFGKNLIFWNINLLIAFIIGGSILISIYNRFPFFIMHIHQVLNFKPGSYLKQFFVISQFEDLQANGISIIEIDNFILAF